MCSVVLSVIAPPSMMERSELVKNVALSCRDSYANSNENYRKLLVLFLKFLSLDIGGAKKKGEPSNGENPTDPLLYCNSHAVQAVWSLFIYLPMFTRMTYVMLPE